MGGKAQLEMERGMRTLQLYHMGLVHSEQEPKVLFSGSSDSGRTGLCPQYSSTSPEPLWGSGSETIYC